MTQQTPLRILIILNLEWNPRLGAVRVYLELAEQWRAAGHVVEHFSLSEAFPRARSSRAGFAIRQLSFAYKAAAFVRKNAARFDVIDALIGSLPMSKKKLGFGGLLVARSVGLYRLYDRFELAARQRWPHRPRGKFLGKIFYSLARQRFLRASDDSVKNADLINLPNENEVECIRRELGSGYRIIVQPYGLTSERRHQLSQASAQASERLAQKKISFIGMWAARKGSNDWTDIIAQVRQKVPSAQFCLFGTMVDAETITKQLGTVSGSGVHFVSEYAPDDLPKLLADCVVGAFPSYVEGFGLAVLEQLAAGIPTVAFDVPGPRDVLAPRAPELLVPAGDVDALTSNLCKILELDPLSYEKLSQRCVEIAAGFDWSKIARETIQVYRNHLDQVTQPPILFVQPFSLGFSGGGGARILRALLERAPVAWQSVCCSPQRPKPWPNEAHLPSRPSWGKIERSRLAMFPKMTMSIFAPRFRRRLKEFCRRSNAGAIHAVPHSGIDFAHAHAVARELSLPFFISVHDDLTYTAAHELSPAVHQPAMRDAWLEADARFVISDALGREYSRRYGGREYQVVTDGLANLNPPRSNSHPGGLRIYFMGLFHLGYEPTFRSLLEGLRIFEHRHPGIVTSVTCRCAHIRPHVWKDIKEVKILPYADEPQIQRDMENTDFLYMPMPFGSDHENFARYSVSTKMVTYIGSGLPILYHGPTTSAAYDLLHRHKAAIFLTSLDPGNIASSLADISETERQEVVANALTLARREFMLSDQTQKFWGTISRCLKTE
jgi:glycosyltransferase involved in cell wall biosynthesis